MRIIIVLFCKKQRDLKESTEAQFDDQDLRERTLTSENDQTGSRTLYPNNMQSALFETDFDRRYVCDATSNTDRNSKQEQFSSLLGDWTESSNHNEQTSRVNSQMDYLPESGNQRGTYKYHGHPLRNENSREEFTSLPGKFASEDFLFSSTQNKETFDFKRPLSKLSVASDITLRGSLELFLDKKGQVSDSLASTVLSVASSGETIS